MHPLREPPRSAEVASGSAHVVHEASESRTFSDASTDLRVNAAAVVAFATLHTSSGHVCCTDWRCNSMMLCETQAEVVVGVA